MDWFLIRILGADLAIFLLGYWAGIRVGDVRTRAEFVQRDMQRLVDQTAQRDGGAA